MAQYRYPVSGDMCEHYTVGECCPNESTPILHLQSKQADEPGFHAADEHQRFSKARETVSHIFHEWSKFLQQFFLPGMILCVNFFFFELFCIEKIRAAEI